MNKGQKQTVVVVLGMILALLLWEGWSLVDRWEYNTISDIIWKAFENPFLVFLYGFLSGHFVWQRRRKQ